MLSCKGLFLEEINKKTVLDNLISSGRSFQSIIRFVDLHLTRDNSPKDT